ncbi:ycf20-like protein [Macadamia integrifolia]|uniref:ycf20-like protein n=1 Tax=Macadamia integrifolia TaxID=60698 RepID=UPI001C4FD39B|nr:ycf20-like protein [Macadamia integrifolia]
MAATMVQSTISILESRSSNRSCITPATYHIRQDWNLKPSLSGKILKVGSKPAPILRKSFETRRQHWGIAFALDAGGTPDGADEDSLNNDGTGLGQTRLGRIVGAGGRQLLQKLNAARKNFPMKIFLLLLGFYTANALATILGQTGDWDVLVAGVIVAAIEGIGMLMYRKPSSLSTGRLQSLITMVNYWKAGVCLGLFVDAFKLGS